MSVIIDAGHGGKDPGAVGKDIIEKDYTLKISLYQFERFKELGVPVKIVRTTDTTLTQAQRTSAVKGSGMKYCISNHINAGGGDGAEVIHSIYDNGKLAQRILDGLVSVGQNPRKIFSRKLPNSSTHDYYYMHRDTGNVITQIVEYGFLDSSKDDIMQLKNDWKKYAESVVKAYCEFEGYPYKPKEEAQPVTNPVTPITRKIFTDVDANYFNYKDIERAKELGFFSGYPDGSFKPDEPITRGQLASVLVRLHDKLKG